MKPAIALFARAPIPGLVKTRLIGRLTPEQACDVHRALVWDAWEMLAAFRPQTEVFLYTDQENENWRTLAGSSLRLQKGSDLGARLLHCFQQLQTAGFGPLLILGSDSPMLTAAALAPWTELLIESPALIGPAEDGGYYAIGCRVPQPAMFEGVEWSSSGALVQTVAALERIGLSPVFLPMNYDVDTPEDLSRLMREPRLPRHIRKQSASAPWLSSRD